MRSFHLFASSVPASPNPGAVTSSNWNDIHQTGFISTAYAANGTVPVTVDYIRATGGAGGIALALTSASKTFTGLSGTYTVGIVYRAKKVDSGAGAITFTDLLGALFEGASSYVLTQQGQWAEFVWNGTGWDVFAGQAA
jgi:hypothetical protein